MPSYNEFITSPSVAAGVPVLELVRKFEEEKLLSREDRIALNEALYNPERRDGIIKALRDLELGDGSRFALRRLKALIYLNGIGEVTSSMYKMQLQAKSTSSKAATAESETTVIATLTADPAAVPTGAEGAAGEEEAAVREVASSSGALSVETTATETATAGLPRSPKATPKSALQGAKSPLGSGSPGRRRQVQSQDDDRSVSSSVCVTQNAIVQVVGEAPVYWGPDNFNICYKISRRLRDFLVKMKLAPSTGKRKFAVLVGEGSMNPLTRMHLRSYFVAKQHLEGQAGFVVLGSLLSPSHGMTVRERYRTHSAEIIPSPHRLAIAQLMVQESKWLSVDPWEITRRRPMDYLSLLQHTRDTLGEYFPGVDIKVMLLCKHNAVPLLSQATLRAENFGVVCPCRATEFDSLKRTLGAKWNGVMWLVEDTAVLDASMDVVTSRRVRDSIRAYRPVENLVGTAIDLYVQQNHLGAKMNGLEEWSEDDKKMPLCAARPLAFSLKSQANSAHGGTSATSAGFTPGVTPYTPSWLQPAPFSAAPPAIQEQQGDAAPAAV